MTLTNLELDGIRFDQIAQLDAECIIWRVTDLGTISKIDATFGIPTSVTVYEGLCAFSPIVARRDRFDTHGEQQIYQNQNRVLVPWDADGIKIGDFLRITVSDDPDLNVRDQEIKDVLFVSDLSLRRLTTIDIRE